MSDEIIAELVRRYMNEKEKINEIKKEMKNLRKAIKALGGIDALKSELEGVRERGRNVDDRKTRKTRK